jgi:hypothetical protein
MIRRKHTRICHYLRLNTSVECLELLVTSTSMSSTDVLRCSSLARRAISLICSSACLAFLSVTYHQQHNHHHHHTDEVQTVTPHTPHRTAPNCWQTFSDYNCVFCAQLCISLSLSLSLTHTHIYTHTHKIYTLYC